MRLLVAMSAVVLVAVLAGSAGGTTSQVPGELAGTWALDWERGRQFLTLGGPRFAFSVLTFPTFPRSVTYP